MKLITIRYPLEQDFNLTRPNDYTLEDAFAEFNAGSCQECREFLGGKIRSLSVGDLVRVDGQWHRCEMSGWSEMSEAEVTDYLAAIDQKLTELRTLENDPSLPPWFAVNDVVYKVKVAKKGGRFYSRAA